MDRFERELRNEARRERSRENGKKSKGPVTEEGKAKSSQNAYKFGFFASIASLARNENSEDFKKLHRMVYERFRPGDFIQHFHVEMVVACMWKLRRVERVESAYMEEGYDIDTMIAITTLEKIRGGNMKRLKDALTQLAILTAEYRKVGYHDNELVDLGSAVPVEPPIVPVEELEEVIEAQIKLQHPPIPVEEPEEETKPEFDERTFLGRLVKR